MVCTERELEIARKYRETHREAQQIYRNLNKEKIAVKAKEYYQKNREQLNAKWREYYHKTRDNRMKYYELHKEERKINGQVYYQNHKEQVLIRTNANYYSHPEKNKEYEENRKGERVIYKQTSRQKNKLVIYKRLSNGEVKCSNPNCLVPGGCKDIRCLQIDHINGGGNAAWKRMGLADFQRYKYLINLPIEELKKNYQLLCANCNWIKKYEKGEVNQYDKIKHLV